MKIDFHLVMSCCCNVDGIVQHLLTNYLFLGKIGHIVGEEDDSEVNILSRPYFVDDLIVPDEFNDIIDSVRTRVQEMGLQIHSDAYKELTVFIDPIDGTREFSTGTQLCAMYYQGSTWLTSHRKLTVTLPNILLLLPAACGQVWVSSVASALDSVTLLVVLLQEWSVNIHQ